MNDTLVSLGDLISYTQTSRILMLDCGGPRIAISILTPHLFRVRLALNGTFAPRRSWSVARSDEEFPEIPCVLEETSEHIIFRPERETTDTTFATIHVQCNPCRISFVASNGQTFCADYDGMQWQSHQKLSRWRVRCTKRIAEDEHFFGFGQRTGLLNARGQTMTNWTTDPGSRQGPATDPLYIAIPVFVSQRPGLSYGFFFNNTWHSRFDMGCSNPAVWHVEADGGELDYYVLFGPTPSEVSQALAQVIGTMPMPPRWALGYHQSRWSYAPEARVREIAAQFRQRSIPCDVLHLDIAYMDGYRVFTWDRTRFPDPTKLIADLRKSGFRVVTIIDPGVKVDPAYWVYREGVANNRFIHRADGKLYQGYVWPDDAVFSDYARPEVQQWWGDLQHVLVEQGVSGIWNDMNEPPVFDQPFSQPVEKRTWHTIDLDAPQGPDDERTIHAEVHNLFGQGMAQASYEGLRRHMQGNRPFVLTRSGFAGIQRWSSCWMGDNTSLWEHLEMSMPQLMNMGLSGVPFVGVDIGGFAGNASGELFARWMQFGAFLPFCRGHTTHFSRDHEPWAFGPRVEAICRDYLTLRYRLLPYIYTLFWEASRSGTPVLCPLFYHFPDDVHTYHLHDQVMLGAFLMIAPIYRPGREHRMVYLPAGTWYNWWSDEQIHGPTHIITHAPLEKLPIYVRAGAIIPTGPAMQWTDERPLDPLTLHLYPGKGSLTLYEDDGLTFAYEQGDYCQTRYCLDQENTESTTCSLLHFTISERTGHYIPPKRHIILRVHALDEILLASSAHATYDPETKILTISFADDGKEHTFVLGKTACSSE